MMPQPGNFSQESHFINRYGLLYDEELTIQERGERLTAFVVDLLRSWNVTAIRHESSQHAVSRLVFSLESHQYVLDITWPAQPLPLTAIARAMASPAHSTGNPRRILLSMAGFEPEDTDEPGLVRYAGSILLNGTHVEAIVSGLLTPAVLFDAASEHAFLTGRAFIPLTTLLVDRTPPVPARMLRPDLLSPPWPVVTSTAPGVDVRVDLVGEPGWGQPLGLVNRGSNSVLITTYEGILEVDPDRGTTHWLLALPGCQGPSLPQPDGSLLVLCRGVVLRWRDDALEPLAGGFTQPATLLPGQAGEPWVLSGFGVAAGTCTGTLALTRLGTRLGQQHRYDLEFDAAVRTAGWLDRLRFFLAASGHSAVVDLGRSSAVADADWIRSPQANPGQLLVVDHHTVITASSDPSAIRVTAYLTDLATHNHELIADLALNGICGLAPAQDGRAFLLADVRGNNPDPTPILVRLSGLPQPAAEPSSPAPLLPTTTEGRDPYATIQESARGQRRDYQLEPRPIDRGGQAEVIQATHKPTGIAVAFKRLTVAHPDAVARLQREVDIARRLGGHRHVMPVLDHSDAYDWFVMPLAEGTAETLRHELAEGTHLRTMIIAICDALRSAHQHGWLHRDVKPANVLKLDDRWILADWGLARRPRGTTTDPNRTRSGTLYGTEGFAAPELSIDAHNAGPATDIYSVGQLIGWILTEQWPQANIPLIPAGQWQNVVEAATQRDPAQRPTTIDAFLALIEDIDSHPVTNVNKLPASSTG